MKGRRSKLRKGRPHRHDWRRRLTRPTVTLAELRARDPLAWATMQELIKCFIRSNREWVRFAADLGVGGEDLHESVERLIDAGLLKIARERRAFRMYLWHPHRRRYEPAGA